MEFLDNVTAVHDEMTDAEFRKAILKLLAEQTDDFETSEYEPSALLQSVVINSIEEGEFYEMILAQVDELTSNDADTDF